jgi:hypothetical protein
MAETYLGTLKLENLQSNLIFFGRDEVVGNAQVSSFWSRLLSLTAYVRE